jgi:NADPH:quinone reductase-like Zn-dependent oxidoreductase
MVGSREMARGPVSFMAKHNIKPVIDHVFACPEAIEALDHQLKGSHFGTGVIKIA